ncbi:helix-turn-helix domain-containing protein [Burkholderia cenocepacia]|uniref:helix-turn-helix domain-containing protein n=1 Tax=Burkholderia cenocepacia TaxID=95486 RepID=UPI002019DB97|nr:helix-turn-helix domain-containing protein [Burkholderia cenocepacia]MCO1396393.1 helix-turn-helix domain-containing protein [Burkholderia cenocepacia]MCO1408967.1 helix-turn-helix domain-containing protein [Burkholderia cenocepacia]UQN92058.1 helix-turn-helix domain-containing protein [Burkholderia cenocepacia]UQN99207.1 helix-turn-helix domain-containing protein [Burkholderia cenocepacia]UQP50838.1 helix-turn-helix domain-containing protein [Burkholderia cenocepacia]
MRLDDYLKEKKLSQAAFAALLTPPVTQSLVSQWIRGTVRVTLDQALQVEKLTAGDVTPKDVADLFRSREVTA